MNSPLYFSFSGNDDLDAQVFDRLNVERGEWSMRDFPDGEFYVRFLTPIENRKLIFFAPLDHPNPKVLRLYLATQVARELGASEIGLIIPYLPYMRQDMRFHQGEGVTSLHFGRLLSSCCDWLVTVDPHLHRHKSMSEVYSCRSTVVAAAPTIANWIAQQVKQPVIVGPDEESQQWVEHVAHLAGCPYVVLRKERRGDSDVSVSSMGSTILSGNTPVLIDDIVSTARTMRSAALQIHAAGGSAPICIGVHPLFEGDAYAALYTAGVKSIVSCNTIAHPSNQIDLSPSIAAAALELLIQN